MGTEARGLRAIGHTDLGGEGDAMGVALHPDGYAYVGHAGRSGVATSVVDVRDPSKPRLVQQITRDPGTRSPKVQVADRLLITNCEREMRWGGPPFVTPTGGAQTWTAGFRIHDVEDPETPREVGFFRVRGAGVHRTTFTGLPYVYTSASDHGYTDQFLRVVDISDPTAPRETGRWWYPGMWEAGGERPRFPNGRRYALHHALVAGGLAFGGWWDAGLVILDVADVMKPQLVANLNWGPGRSGATHTALPLPARNLLVVADECIVSDCRDIQKQVRVLDVSDPYSPRTLSTLPVPAGPFCERGGRFGPHNLAEPRPHTLVQTDRVYVAYFNAGLRVVSLSDPIAPREIAWFIPEAPPGSQVPQVDDVTVDPEGRIYLTDRAGGGLWIVEPEG